MQTTLYKNSVKNIFLSLKWLLFLQFNIPLKFYNALYNHASKIKKKNSCNYKHTYSVLYDFFLVAI